MKPYIAHYKNKYPGSKIQSTEQSFDVFDKDGGHRVSLEKNGAGQMVCVSEAKGCIDRHDLSPIPKNSRAYKLYKKDESKGRSEEYIGKSEEYEERSKVGEKLAAHECGGKGKVPSLSELESHGEELSKVDSSSDARQLGGREWKEKAKKSA